MNTMAKWIKTTPYGDYRDPLQNHKFDNFLVLNTKTNKFEIYNKVNNIFHEAQWYFGKHIGSKKLSKVVEINSKASNKRALFKKVIKQYQENKESQENQENNADK